MAEHWLLKFDPALVNGIWFGVVSSFVFSILMLIAHLQGRFLEFPTFLTLNVLGVPALVSLTGLLALAHIQRVHLFELITVLLSYGIYLFCFICEILLRNGALWLTEKRGESWVKEIDYLYLALGTMGLLLTIARLPVIIEKIALPEIFGSTVLMTAIVLRAIKTRADVGQWQKR